MKYRIRQSTIVFSKQKAKQRRNKLADIENRLRKSELLCATDPTENNIENLEKVKIEYDSMYDYITQGNIIRSRATWYEKGEKINKYFLTLEKNRRTKNCIRKLFNKQGKEIVNSKAIITELKDFYEDLYEDKDSDISANDLQNYIKNLNMP